MANALGVVFGVIIVCFLFGCCYKFFYKKQFRDKKRAFSEKVLYDERQLLARGCAYKAGFYSLMIYLIGIIILEQMKLGYTFVSANSLWLGIVISIGIFAIVCILKDAYMSMYENSKMVFGFLVGMGIFNVFIGVTNYHEKNTTGFTNLSVGIMMLIVCSVFYIKKMHDKYDEE